MGVDDEISERHGDLLASFSVGSRIASYRLEERIGVGGMAVVFRASDERLGRQVALKVLSPPLAQDEDFRQRFNRESRIAASVDDPHIIPVFDADEAQGVLYIAMRYVPGGDAHTLLQREGKLPPDRVAAMVSPIASALDAAHAKNLVHRDVKPANMLLDVRPDRPDHVYLSDFGLTKNSLATDGLTATGTILGTVAYSSPEQLSGRPVDGRADEYSLACSAVELLTGTVPFPRDALTAAILAHLTDPPPSLSERVPGLPVAVDEVIARAMAKAPDQRYPNCTEFADALRAALGLPGYRPGADATRNQQPPTKNVHAQETVVPANPPVPPVPERPPGTPPPVVPPPVTPTPVDPIPPPPRQNRRGMTSLPVLAAVVILGLAVVVGAGVTADKLLAGPAPAPTRSITPTPTPTPTPDPNPAVSPFAGLAGVITPGHQVTAAVYDAKTHRTWLFHPGIAVHAAGVIRIAFLADALKNNRAASLQFMLQSMIDDNDNGATTTVEEQLGGPSAVQEFVAEARLTRTLVSTDELIPGSTDLPGWGWSTTTALDQVNLMKDFAYPNPLLTSAERATGLDDLEDVNSAYTWGVTAGAPQGASVALTNGWLPLEVSADTDYQMNTVGWIDGNGSNYVLAIFDQGSSNYNSGISAIDQLAEVVNRNLGADG